MNIIETPIEGVKIIEPKVFGDARGYFFESWNKAAFAAAGIEADFVQDNESFSTYGVLRGLHYQMPPYTQAKLVRVIEGTVLDIVVDIRKGSPTFGRNVAVELSGENKRQLFAPRGMAHGFDDPKLGIDWQIPPENYLLSEKDRKGVPFDEAEYL